MRVRVRLFASLREEAGLSELDLDLPEGATAEAAWAELQQAHPALSARRGRLSVAVNRAYRPFDVPLAAGDEIVFIPPISGG
ncbi:MAG TPA: molybdopterin converting factor subunit 1 [Vicinamibacteria bacterium]|nr:molybdopterin converting factor subunit 1 [Vicinamibacteria bacterium]